jgi:hypothetical protein
MPDSRLIVIATAAIVFLAAGAFFFRLLGIRQIYELGANQSKSAAQRPPRRFWLRFYAHWLVRHMTPQPDQPVRADNSA